MNRTIALLTGAGLGASMMFFLDPRRGKQRRAQVRDKMIRLSHQAQDARDTIVRDARNRISGLAAGDMSVLIGGKNALRGNPLRGGWSPAGRVMLGAIGGGLFLSGLTRSAPTACILGTAGLALMIEAATNAGIEDISNVSSKVERIARENFGHDGRKPRRPEHVSV
ncbi:MAG TPA: YtxH domain-containing protein [Gemmataceae bacterium]